MSSTSLASPGDQDLDQIESLLTYVYESTHLDFRDYARSSLKRRILRRVQEEKTGTVAGLTTLIHSDPTARLRLVNSLTIHVTSMFRDPTFFQTLRSQIVPVLKTHPFVRLWVAGCATGEEVYSLAILLHEEGLYPRCRLYATDLSDRVISQARGGIFPLSVMQTYTRNYQLAGGQRAFADYYTADDEFAIFRPFLKENILFASHNLSSDASFNQFQMIFCRNVMIYFNRQLQDRVYQLFDESLITYGYLGLGKCESVRFSSIEKSYEDLCKRERIYRKIR